MSCKRGASSRFLVQSPDCTALQLYGLVWSGPSLHYWQQLQERIFRGKRDNASLVKRVWLFSWRDCHQPWVKPLLQMAGCGSGMKHVARKR